MSEYSKRTQVGKAEFLAAIPGCRGQLEPIEHKLNCTRRALKDLLKEHPDLQEELDDELERELDRTIYAAFEDAQNPDSRTAPKSRELILKAKARDRGFGDRMEVTGADGAPLVFLHTAAQMPDSQRWQITADEYAQNEDAAIEAKMRELGIGNTPVKQIGGK